MENPRRFSSQWWHKDEVFLFSLFVAGTAHYLAWIPGHDWVKYSQWGGLVFCLSFLPVPSAAHVMISGLRWLFRDQK